MKKRYFLLVTIFLSLITIIIITRKPEQPVFKLHDRKGAISNNSEWLNTKEAIETLQDDIRRNPNHIEAKIKLAQGYMQEARVTGDHQYYDALAYQLVNEVLKKDAKNFEALSCKATLQATAHQFADALITCKEVIKINPYNAYIYGVLCDANVELGNYEDAVKVADKMVSIRPDIRSYSRISYLREILGDYPGAIQAMTLALHSNIPGLEQTEWTRVYLGRLHELTGDITNAEHLYTESLLHRAHYAPALAGLGRIAKSKKEFSKAIDFYKQAAKAQNDYAYHQELGELFAITKQQTESTKEFEIAQDILIKHQHPTSEENGIGHNIDRELAQLFLSMHEYDLAYNSAAVEYARRPKNIDVNETLAWACYQNKKYVEAQHYIVNALSTHSQNAELLYKAGMIMQKNNHPLVAQVYFKNALKINAVVQDKFNTQPLAEMVKRYE